MHPLLERQIRRYLGEGAAIPEAWQPLLRAIGAAYEQADDDHKMVEHSLDLMSQELTERNRELRQQLDEKQLSEMELSREKVEQAALIKRLEEAHNQLLQSEKMASIGQLAAGVAHEINNPIGYVNSNLATLRSYVGQLLAVLEAYEGVEDLLPEGGTREGVAAAKRAADLDYLKADIVSLLDESSEGIDRVRRIVQDLKDFSHVDKGEWVLADLHKGMDSTLNVVTNEIKYKAHVVKEYGQLPMVRCLPSQMNQVFMNLLVNAAHAIERQGEIRVRTGVDGGNVWIEIADTGGGIPEHLMTRIFDPFFTTKPVGKGTGLGLSISYGIVRKHGGHIEVESEMGRGTVFRIILPIHPVESEETDHG